MTREEWEKQREEALRNRMRSKFVASAGDFILVKQASNKDGAKNTNAEKFNN